MHTQPPLAGVRIVELSIAGPAGTTTHLADLVAESDVVLEAMRPGMLDRRGVGYDTWAGIVTPEVDEEGFTHIPEHVSIGMYAAPMLAATSILASVIRARDTGGAASSSSGSPTRPPSSTGTAPRRGWPTAAPNPRSPATRPTGTCVALPGPPA